MKITLITQDFLPKKGGIATYLKSIWEQQLQHTDFEAIVPPDLSPDVPFPVYQMRMDPFNLDRQEYNNKMRTHLEKRNPDIILIGYLRSHPEVALQYRDSHPGTKVAIFTHAKEVFLQPVEKNNIDGTHKGYTTQEGEFYKSQLESADCVFAVSNFTKQILMEQTTCNPVILHPALTHHPSNIQFDNGQELHLLTVGRLIERKGHAKVIDALQYIPGKYTIVGEGPRLPHLKQQVTDLRLEDRVNFAGAVADPDPYYRNANAFVMPCKFIPPNDVEGFGIVFLEAGSYGLPVIGGNTGGVPDAITDNENGILINPDEPSELRNALLKLLDPTSRLRLGTAGMLRSRAKYPDILATVSSASAQSRHRSASTPLR